MLHTAWVPHSITTEPCILQSTPAVGATVPQVKQYAGDVSELGLTFTAEYESFGQTVSQELLPGRGAEPVTNTTRLLYCHLLADWHVNGRLGRAADAFARGLAQVVPLPLLRCAHHMHVLAC